VIHQGEIVVLKEEAKGVQPTRKTVSNALKASFIELFFAVLPLVILGASWPSDPPYHPHSFWVGPEIPMVACIVYGLALARWLQGSVIRAAKLPVDQTARAQHMSISVVLVAIAPIFGIAFSGLLIRQTMVPEPLCGWVIANYAALIISVFLYVVVGGFGVFSSEEMSGV
jgi:hypothetical protein